MNADDIGLFRGQNATKLCRACEVRERIFRLEVKRNVATARTFQIGDKPPAFRNRHIVPARMCEDAIEKDGVMFDAAFLHGWDKLNCFHRVLIFPEDVRGNGSVRTFTSEMRL